jgi:hypothetical protein
VLPITVACARVIRRTMKSTIIVVGAHPAMSEASHGILRRCGFIAIEAPSLDSARDLIHHGTRPTFVVTMLRGLSRGTTSDKHGSLSAFLDDIRPIITPNYTIAVTTKALWDDDVRQCEVMGMHVLLDQMFSFRALARFLIDLQGGDGARCCPVEGQRRHQQPGPTGAPQV